MTPEELKELAGLIKKRWPKQWEAIAGERHLAIIPTGKVALLEYCPDLPDFSNARFLVWGLDRLEEQGYELALYKDCDEFICEDAGFYIHGKTRAEAVARALLEALRREGVMAGWNVYQGPYSTYTVVGTPIFIGGQMIAIAVEQDWESTIEDAIQAQVDKQVAEGMAYSKALFEVEQEG